LAAGQKLTLLKANRLSKISVIGIDARWWRREVVDVGNDNRLDAAPGFQALLSYTVDGDVLDGGQFGRKRGVQEIQDGVGLIALALPEEVVMVADGIDAQLGDQTGQADTQRQIHRDGQGVLHDDQIDPACWNE